MPAVLHCFMNLFHGSAIKVRGLCRGIKWTLCLLVNLSFSISSTEFVFAYFLVSTWQPLSGVQIWGRLTVTQQHPFITSAWLHCIVYCLFYYWLIFTVKMAHKRSNYLCSFKMYIVFVKLLAKCSTINGRLIWNYFERSNTGLEYTGMLNSVFLINQQQIH